MSNLLLLEFAESPKETTVNYALFEYNSVLNLTVFKGTATPAIRAEMVITQEITKVNNNEGSTVTDKSTQAINYTNLITQTETLRRIETSDSDNDIKNFIRINRFLNSQL